MVSKQMVAAAVATAIAVVLLPALASATDHVVGDAHGWTLGFDYAAWAESKQFTVGDTLVFKYSTSSHDVAEVSGADFKACNKASAASVWSSGADVVTLDKPGRRWFVCAVGEHCRLGMKLNVTVLPGTPAPAPAPALAPAPAPSSYPHSRRFLSEW
ncbi:unnamed protein product [Urochloa decumbens]|uniref:Phytocyanin domain-containing protein n=1 Tax=Urochloa decumbens TaxID=240449 RepID=A0ABC8XLL5_9POAL